MPTEGIRPLVAGNWKMNGLRRSVDTIDALKRVRRTVCWSGSTCLFVLPRR
jgi:triosephosphate isomerase